jgi:flagellar protein FlaI
MGLLDKAQLKKKPTKEEELQEKEDTKKQEKKKGLLEKAKQKKEKVITEEKEEKTTKEEKIEEAKQKTAYTGIKTGEDDVDVIEEKKGFGWKGLGTRRIVFDHTINEYIYELIEPVLSNEEKELKNELSRLFKMLSDIDVTEIEEEEKAKYLEETLEQIIEDNNFKFDAERYIKKPEKEKTSLFSKKEKINKTKEKKKFTLKKEKTPKTKENKEKGKKLNLKQKKEELTPEEKKLKDKVFYHIFRDFLGYGRIDIVMKDTGIEDISCDGHHVPLFIYHKKYDAIPTNIWFENDEELDSFVVRLAQVSGKQISVYSPIVDGKLPDGSRLQTTLSKTVTRGSTFTIRKFKENPLTPIDLIDYQSISMDMAAYFWMAIERGASILFCGGTASGKTTALNALSLFIPAQNKIITIEDTREVNLPHKNWIAGTTREGFSSSDDKSGKDIDMFDLIRAALRQRPKVVMVGEVRGKEAYSLFQAMATGHTSYATVHASDIHTLIQRLENPPISLPRALLTSLDVIVFQNAIDIKGKTVRRMTSVTEIVKLDPDTNQLIFMEPFRWVSKTDDRFDSAGASKILNEIKLQNDWSDKEMEDELEKRKTILNWMLENNIRDYKDVGRIVSDYSKYPDKLLKKAKEETKK